MMAPLEWHLKQGTVLSAEMLAPLVMTLQSRQMAAALIADCQGSELQILQARLNVQLKLAFYNRRSLLLTGMQSQIGLKELPWCTDIANQEMQLPREGVLEVYRQIAWSALTSFPETQLPNKLITVLKVIRETLQFKPSLTMELAADIFEGGFAKNFVQMAKNNLSRH